MWPFNSYPREWSRAKKKALDMMQVWTVQTPFKDEDFRALTDKVLRPCSLPVIASKSAAAAGVAVLGMLLRSPVTL